MSETIRRPEGRLRRVAYPAALASLFVVNVLLTLYFVPPEVVLDDEPMSWLDFSFHVTEAKRVGEALESQGRAWAYDPHLLAGYPVGAVFDADNKAWELWTHTLGKLGVDRWRAFNLFVPLIHLLLPLMVLVSARLFDLSRWAALLAASLATLVWYFDSFTHYCWYVGMVSFAASGYLTLLPLALFHRALKRRRWYHFALLAAALALTHLVHPFAFVVLVVPMVVMYAHAVRALSRLAHLGVAAAVGITIAANAYWLTTALEFWRYVRDVRVFCQGTALDLVTDLLGIVRDPAVTGRIGNLAGIRMLLLAAAILCLLGWRRRGDRRVAVFATAIGASLAFAYLGSYTWLLAQLQPYRFVVPAAFLTVVPAAALLIDDPERFTLQGLPRSRKWLLALLLLLAAARPAVEASSYFLEPLTARGFDFRHRPNQETFREVADWVSRADDGDGRFLVEWWPLGEYLAWKTDAQMLGGFPFRNLEHIAAHPLFRGHHGRKDGGDLERYLEQYAVKWIIVTRRRPGIENRHDLLERVGSQGGALGLRHRVYRVRTPSGLIAGNRGSARASLNRIEVTGTDPARDVVLRYHWLETLVCREGCTVEREPIEDDPVGFIRVPAPHPPDFEIVNGY